MSEQPPVLVIEYGSESYVKADRYGYSDRYIVNGRSWPRAVGDSSFYVVQGAVKTLAYTVPPRTVTTKYTLRADLICANKPAWLTPAQWEALPESDRALYQAEQETQQQPSVDLPFTIVNGKAAPRQMPQGIVPILPAHVNVYPWFWWTLPCQATREYTFGQLVARVKALDPSQFAVTVYTNIKSIWVQASSFDLGGVEFRPQQTILRIDKDNREAVPLIDGADLDDVVAKVAAWCDAQMAPVTAAMSVAACPCCRQKLPKGKRARITARERGRRTGHDIQ